MEHPNTVLPSRCSGLEEPMKGPAIILDPTSTYVLSNQVGKYAHAG